MRTFWLSFCDPDRPEGQKFLGAAVVDVTDEEAAAVTPLMRATFPLAQDGAEWIAAATGKAHAFGCNPGGEVSSVEITGAAHAALYPRNQLMSKAEIEALEPALEN